jgi:hypothetical protein
MIKKLMFSIYFLTEQRILPIRTSDFLPGGAEHV